MSEHVWTGPPPTARPEGGFLVAIRAGAPNAPRCWIDMGGTMPEDLESAEPTPEVVYMRDLWPNVR